MSKFAIELTEEQQRLFAQNREARVVDRPNRILRLKERGHQRWKLCCKRRRVRGASQWEAEGEVILAHDSVSISKAAIMP
jgi:hypothetical protein